MATNNEGVEPNVKVITKIIEIREDEELTSLHYVINNGDEAIVNVDTPLLDMLGTDIITFLQESLGYEVNLES